MIEQKENLSSFFKDNSKLAREYFETEMEIYRLKAVRLIAKTGGYFIWVIISVLLVFLFFIFLGAVAGLWLSTITGSYITGFGITTLAILAIIIVLALLRKALFVNPIIKAIIHRSEPPNSDN